MSKKEEKEKPLFKINGTFSIHVTNRKAKKAIIHSIKEDCVHIRNMVLILRKELYAKSQNSKEINEIYKLFLSNEVLRETIYGRNGRNDGAIKIKKLRDYFEEHKLFNALCKFSQQKLDPKNFISILKEIKKNFDNFFTSLESYLEDPIAHARKMGNSGAPQPPKPKKLARINNASLIIESSKWSLKKETKVVEKLTKTTNKKGLIVEKREKIKEIHAYIRVKIGKYTQHIPVNWAKFPIPEGQTLRSLNISHTNGSIYLNFSYGKLEEKGKKAQIKKVKKKKYASGDVGLINVLSVFVNDLESPSFMLSGRRFIKYNCNFNKHIAKLDKTIAKEAIEWKEITRIVKNADGDVVTDKQGNDVEETTQIATKHTQEGNNKKQFRAFLFEKRNRFFKEEFEKMSTLLVEYFQKTKVTDFVSSRNLSFAKTEGSIKMRKKTQQKFYQIPFGEFLNMMDRKCENKGINFHDIDEAHTSKTSCLSKNVNEIVTLRAQREKSLSTNDYGGSRVKRGFYKDFAHKILFHADINGAINHLKIRFKTLNFEWLLKNKRKICNPYLFKSDYDFRRQLLGESLNLAA